MARQTLSLRRRLRKRLRAAGAGVTRYVGNHPLVAGVAGTLIAVAMAGLTLLTLGTGRADALDHARQTSQNLVAIISGDLARNVEIYDLSLQAMVDGARDNVAATLPADVRRAVLFDRATTAAYLGGAYLIGPKGEVIASQNDDVNDAVRLADRDYFLVHQRSPTVGLYFSHPFRSRLRDGKLSVGLTRRIDDASGAFAGVALLAIRIEYFQHLLDRIDTGQLGSVFIVMDDGTLLARKPFVPRDIGSSMAKSPTFERMSAHTAGTYVARSSMDGVRRMYTYARVPGTPLIAAVAPSVDEVLAPWWHRSRIAGAMTLAFGAVFVTVSWLLAFALRDKLRAQAALLRLAATDPLTGLGNRRVLDNRLDEEWRRAQRSGQPLSVLFIDVDHFKHFNDAYGHASGDEALITVAECISAAVRRSVDVVARYGGEEFAVVLPDTAAEGALSVAEKIRRKVQGRDVVQSDGAPVTVTVSVGCATCVPAMGESAHDLLAAADRQLYAAKAGGRNRTCSAQWAAASVAQDSSA
ncbi:GGDEF domain-containing protein [Paraburkholderia ginsengisoli]|uniref:diguanylate cyclase n=1 Tax=Paraburkholderia ginsengisoli TaxID=311231 RepID=A0A7T4N6R3_9BURK|nr:sensor domain-containing diguanylate cyclase [Paraburkholderia ginsengisoli]QQC66265.1 GGDEF domain-containing protein [Paraburkholderia ginsengisoli]